MQNLYEKFVSVSFIVGLFWGLTSDSAIAGTTGHLGSSWGGAVLPATARVDGYSLKDMARATAAFNVTDHSGQPPNIPVQMLYTTATNTFDVEKGTAFYVPVWQSDDSYPTLGHFPNVSDRKAVLNYVNSQSEFGIVDSIIAIDGKETRLDNAYVAAVKLSQPLTDFLPPATTGGKQYLTIAAFLSPLKPGTHTVEIRGRATGAAILPWSEIIAPIFNIDPFPIYDFSISYTVNVH